MISVSLINMVILELIHVSKLIEAVDMMTLFEQRIARRLLISKKTFLNKGQ